MEPFSQFEMLAIKNYRQHVSDVVRNLKRGVSSDLTQVNACVMPSGDMICRIRKSSNFFIIYYTDSEQFVYENKLPQLLSTVVPGYLVKKHFPELLL